MMPSNALNLLKMLGISLVLCLPVASAANELAEPSATPIDHEAQLSQVLDKRFDEWVEAHLDPVLSDRMMADLNRSIRLARRSSESMPSAMASGSGDFPTSTTQLPGNTCCKMVGRTLECVLHEVANR